MLKLLSFAQEAGRQKGNNMRVYVAGKISDNNIIDCLKNIRNGINESVKVLLHGMYPFSPFIDFQFTLNLKDNEEIKLQDYYDYSMAWLEVSDVVYVQGDNYRESKGTMAEIKRAEGLNIPIVYSFEELLKYKESHDKYKR